MTIGDRVLYSQDHVSIALTLFPPSLNLTEGTLPTRWLREPQDVFVFVTPSSFSKASGLEAIDEGSVSTTRKHLDATCLPYLTHAQKLAHSCLIS